MMIEIVSLILCCVTFFMIGYAAGIDKRNSNETNE